MCVCVCVCVYVCVCVCEQTGIVCDEQHTYARIYTNTFSWEVDW